MQFSNIFFSATLLAGAWSLPALNNPVRPAGHRRVIREARNGHNGNGNKGNNGWGNQATGVSPGRTSPTGYSNGQSSAAAIYPSSSAVAGFSPSSVASYSPGSSSAAAAIASDSSAASVCSAYAASGGSSTVVAIQTTAAQSSTPSSIATEASGPSSSVVQDFTPSSSAVVEEPSSTAAAAAATSADSAATAISTSSYSAFDYDETWTGAALNTLPSGKSWESIVGTFVIPTLSAPSGRSGNEYTTSAWIGIDGTSAEGGLLQAGVDFVLESNGDVSYNTWVEWYPDGSIYPDNFEASAGDSITVTITSNTTVGTVIIENNTNGDKITQTLTAPDSSSTLELQSVEWIVEDFEYGYSGEYLVDWGNLTFTGCSATTTDGTSYTPSDSPWVMALEQSDTVYSSVSVAGDEVTIDYVG